MHMHYILLLVNRLSIVYASVISKCNTLSIHDTLPILPIHSTKLENEDNLYENNIGNLLSPPNKETLETLPEMTENTFKISPGQYDIVFPGLGWITTKTGDITVSAHSPKGTATSIRQSFF